MLEIGISPDQRVIPGAGLSAFAKAATSDDRAQATPAAGFVGAPPIPVYLEETYWWAYVRPWAIRIFERKWLTNMILLGNYARLRDAALGEIGSQPRLRTLQVACVYGDLSIRLAGQVADADGTLDVVDVVPLQLRNLQRKLDPDADVGLLHRDSTSLGIADASYDRVVLFFLLHEQPWGTRRRTLAEAVRVTRPGGKIILVDYDRPRWWHPLRGIMRAVLGRLEPFALDLWTVPLDSYVPEAFRCTRVQKCSYFGDLYQMVVMTR